MDKFFMGNECALSLSERLQVIGPDIASPFYPAHHFSDPEEPVLLTRPITWTLESHRILRHLATLLSFFVAPPIRCRGNTHSSTGVFDFQIGVCNPPD
jgi:hypothetical protein